MFTNREEKKVEAEITNSSNTIAKGTIVYGDIETHGNLRIEGRVEGSVTTKSKVVLGKSSQIAGNIFAQNAEVEGKVHGKIQVTEMLILKNCASVDGDIITNKLVVEAGASFNGGCKMGVSGSNRPENRFVEKKQTVSSNPSTMKEPQKAGTI